MTALSVKPPTLLRADTIDLQSQQNPSAKDHSRGQYGAGYNLNVNNNSGGHHAQALRNASQDAYQEMQSSPRVGGFDHNHNHNHHHNGPHAQMHIYDDGDDDDDDDHPTNGVNGNHDGSYDDDNDSQDEDMDDELLDKISSSPSIEDGKQPWPPRADSLPRELPPSSGALPSRGISYFPVNPAHGPTHLSPHKSGSGSHQSGRAEKSLSPRQNINFGHVPQLSPTRSPNKPRAVIPYSDSLNDITRHLLPTDDPFLDNSMDDDLDYLAFDDQDPDWIDEGIGQDDDSSDDDHDDLVFTSDSRFIDSGWGGECLRELEDIDFEFVYALHTFVATVEGQANATKGDTMVLLDDSNSYWWLVRVVKDASIGYLPAEHIETPTERLARLNKHRNIDLAAAMLGDNPEKSKNPLKKAIRRRNAKTVNFAPPTYYDADPRVWSDEEDDEEDGDDGDAAHAENNTSQQEQQSQQSQQNRHGQQGQQLIQSNESQNVQPVAATIHRVESNEDSDDDEPTSPNRLSTFSTASTLHESQENVRKTKSGTVRNTDSFFRDDTVETKKISLTPRLLRSDTDSSISAEHEVKRRASPDALDKAAGEDKSKDGKKKEKKNMLSGLFKRKDKGSKGSRPETDDADRNSEDSGRSPQSNHSVDDVASDRRPTKLQKNAQAPIVSPKNSPTDARAPQRDYVSSTPQQQGTAPIRRDTSESVPSSQASSHLAPEAQQHQPSRFPSLQEKRSVFAPITGALRSKTSSQDVSDLNPTVKPVYSKRAKERFAIEASDSEDDSTPTAQSSIHRTASPEEYHSTGNGRPDSGMRMSSLDTQDVNKANYGNAPLSSENKERSGVSQQTNSTASPTTPSDQTASTSKRSPSVATHTPSTSRSTPTWSDASLRSYMDNDQDVRDLLVIVHDKTNVTAVGHEHALMHGLFASERSKLADMQTQLDSLLLSWLSKKQHGGSGTAARE